MVTSDGPKGSWADHMARSPSDPTITLDPYTVELLCGGTCRWCQERDVEIERLGALVTELRTALRFNGVEGY